MSEPSTTSPPHLSQFEVLPLARTEEEAARVGEPLQLTVTCSPRHGPDESVAVARSLRAQGHAVTVHLAARMVRDRAHLDELMSEMAELGLDDLFLIGGDATPPLGAYSSAMDLLPLIREHPQCPDEIGIAGYPEGHPLIDDEELATALEQKSSLATYITTQLCFDPDRVLDWVGETRDRGVTLPVFVGLPGVVDRRRLLAIAVRIGVGPSLGFVRKQRGLRRFLRPSKITPDSIYEAVAPRLDDRELNIAGFHYYTFNQLVDTWIWEREKRGDRALAAQF